MNKATLRSLSRRQPSPAGAGADVQRRLLREDWWAMAFQVGLYRAVASEPATNLLMQDLFARGARVAVPKARKSGYGWCWVEAYTPWQVGAQGIAEPARARWVAPTDLRVIVVPGVAFDIQGGRLGRGGGHYDRLLQGAQALLVGLTFENRLVAAVPREAHDVSMDIMVTEKQTRYTKRAASKLARLLTGHHSIGFEE